MSGSLVPGLLSVPPPPYSAMVTAMDGRVRVRRPRVIGPETAVLVTIGQSLMANYVGGERLGGDPRILQVNLFDGALYVAQDPLLGVDTFLPDPAQSNMATRLARLILASGLKSRVIILPLAVGGSHVAQWAAGGLFHPRIPSGMARLRGLGLTPDAILWQQGTTDNSLNTPAESYRAALQSAIDTFRAEGATCPILVAQDSWFGGDLDLQVRKGQRLTWNPAAGVHPGPDIDLISDRRDFAHMTAAGGELQAAAWFAALRPFLTS